MLCSVVVNGDVKCGPMMPGILSAALSLDCLWQWVLKDVLAEPKIRGRLASQVCLQLVLHVKEAGSVVEQALR